MEKLWVHESLRNWWDRKGKKKWRLESAEKRSQCMTNQSGVHSRVVCVSSLARTSFWATGPNPVYETGKEIAKWTEVATGNNDTHRNNAEESWTNATWLCNDDQHLFTLPKRSRGLCNATASPQLLRNWWLGYFVPDSGHHDNKVKRVSLCQDSIATKCKRFLWTSIRYMDSTTNIKRCQCAIREITFIGFHVFIHFSTRHTTDSDWWCLHLIAQWQSLPERNMICFLINKIKANFCCMKPCSNWKCSVKNECVIYNTAIYRTLKLK